MRAAYLVVAAVVVSFALFAHAWAHGARGDERLDFGLRSALHCDGDECWTHDLDDFYNVDGTGQLEGELATYALGVAAIVMLIAATMVRSGPIERGFQLLFAAPCALAIVTTIAYAHRLTSPRSHHIGWVPIVAVAALAIGLCAIFVQQPPPES